MDAHRPDRRRLPGDARHRVQRLRAGRAETAVRRPAAGHAAVALAGLRADRAGGRRQPGHHDHDHQPPLADRACRRRLAHLPADLVRPAAGGRGAVRADVRLDPRRPLGVRVVHRRRLGRADPGPAQPDDPVAGDRHGPARPLPVQRRAGQSVTSQLKPAQAGGGPADQVRPARPARPDAPGPVGRWRAAAPAILRRHWLAAALLAAGLVLRVLTLLAYRPALFYIDTTRYLYDAQGMDPVGYKGPLRAILLVANFNAVAAVQHLLGLAMAVVIYLLLLRRGVPRWLAALAIAPVLLDAYQLQQEQAVMPGTWFEALIVAGLAILLWRPRASWRAVVAGGIVLGTSATFAQVGEALILPAVIYVLAAGGRPSAKPPPCAPRSPCPSWPTAPGPCCSPGTSSCRTRASPRSTGGWRRRRTAPRSGCRPPSGACARPRPSGPSGPTGSSTATAPRSGPTTRACRGTRPTG